MMQWSCKSFDELTNKELYAILQLRDEVFVVEQQCIYLDADGKDLHCHHMMGWKNDQLVAYTRLVPPGISYKEVSIGRVVSSPSVRGTGIGRELMQRSIGNAWEIYGMQDIVISAQYYLLEFYRSLGFAEEGDVYPEDEIPHIQMRLKPAAAEGLS